MKYLYYRLKNSQFVLLIALILFFHYTVFGNELSKNTSRLFKDKKFYFSLLVFQADGNVGYILMWRALDENLSVFNETVNTFHTDVPFSERIKGIVSWIKNTIFVLIFIGFLFLLGYSGYLLRKGVETKKVLIKVKNEAQQKGWVITEEWHKFNRKSILWIVVPVLSWTTVYTFMFIILSLKIFLFSLLCVIPIVLGYFGVFFVPNFEGIVEDIATHV